MNYSTNQHGTKSKFQNLHALSNVIFGFVTHIIIRPLAHQFVSANSGNVCENN